MCLTSYTSAFAQPCTPCPPVFTLRDSINCNNADVVKPASGIGPYTNLFAAITACKNSTMKYQLTTNAACYPIVNYTIINVSGGILLSATANQFLIQWGASATGNVLIAFSIPPGGGSAPCRDTISLNFTLINSPIAAFTSSPQPACFNSPTNISFNSSGSVNAVTYFWDFGDGFTSTQANPVHAYTSPGTYTVTLTTNFGRGCVRTATVNTITVVKPVLPNVITPNNDGLNDTFKPRVSCLPLNLKIYSRWGNLAYETDNYNEGFDGGNLSSGVYYYLIRDSNNGTWKGWLEIIR